MKKDWRIYLFFIFIFLIGSGVLTRLFSLQIFRYQYYSAWAHDQHQIYQEIFPDRGEIFIQDLSIKTRTGQDYYYPLAINKEFYQVYIVPKNIIEETRDDLANQLSLILDLDKETILQRMSKPDDPYEPLKHKVEKEAADRIKDLKAEGVEVSTETWRYFPNGALACHLTGFVGESDKGRVGQYGLESYYEDELKGKDGFIAGEKDTNGYWIPSLGQKFEPAEDGADLILTIDQNIQFRAEKELDGLLDKWQATSGDVIIMNPKTGAILAMASRPAFNPNEYGKTENIDVFLNPSIQKVYELGSIFKPITMASGLDTDKVKPETTYYDEGRIQIKGSFIANVDGASYGKQTMTQVLEKSINTGAVFVQRAVGEKAFQDYIQNFGFSQPTGIDLVGEVGGDISNLFSGREINLATISFGQGITVTPLEMVNAIAAIANEGKLMRPYVVEKKIWPDGREEITQPQEIRQVISAPTAATLTKMLVSVVDNGYGKPARISNYSIAGKTGTAQIPDLQNGGYSEETIHSFVGFAPAFNPEFVILIKMDKPSGIRFASDSVSPVFKKLASYLFGYLEIPPQ
ncbi:penicillin-binding protein 2 [Patescibacteria group bacterium]|nr:penicillin-binding protein 2 [Patescibacteria group bacterium]